MITDRTNETDTLSFMSVLLISFCVAEKDEEI